MLSKLLKYELRASGRILLPVYALLLASAGCCSLFYKLAADHPYRTGAASVLMGLLMMAFWIFVVATGAITALLMIYRFYKNYMTDEGYLMFTLPVNRHQLIWAKLLSALLYTAASAVAVPPQDGLSAVIKAATASSTGSGGSTHNSVSIRSSVHVRCSLSLMR